MGIKVLVNSTNTSRISIKEQNRTVVRTVGISSAEARRLENLSDVDVGIPENNETLVYNSTTQKYEVKILPIVDGGIF